MLQGDLLMKNAKVILTILIVAFIFSSCAHNNSSHKKNANNVSTNTSVEKQASQTEITISSNTSSNVSNSKQQTSMLNYISKDYQISMQYPSNLKLDSNYYQRYDDGDTFFQFDAITGNDTPIDSIVNDIANHTLLPYGSAPTIESLVLQGQPARLILPSEDQPKGMNKQACVIIKYPTPILISATKYNYLKLYADVAHIKDFANSIKFSK